MKSIPFTKHVLSDNFSYTRLANSELVFQMTRPNGITTTWSYESNRDLITQVQNGTISTYGYVNDAIGQRTSMSRSGSAYLTPDTIFYTYNDRSELTGAQSNVDASYSYSYAYDPIGNRITANEAGVPWSYTTNNLNQYTSATENNVQLDFAYDLDGSMTYRPVDATSGWTQIWNCENCWTPDKTSANYPSSSGCRGSTFGSMKQKQGVITLMKSQNLCLSILCLSLLLAVSCFNEKSSKDTEAEVDKCIQWPTISIDDFYFQEASQFSTPNEFIEKYGSPAIERPWLSYPDKFEEGYLLYNCVIKENNEIACPSCGLSIYFIRNSSIFTLDAWEIEFPQMNTQNNFMTLNDLKQAMPLGTPCQQVRKILGQPNDIYCRVVNASRSNEELIYHYCYLRNEIGMYQDRYAFIRLLCTFVNQKLSSVQMEFYEEMSLQSLFDPERQHIEKY